MGPAIAYLYLLLDLPKSHQFRWVEQNVCGYLRQNVKYKFRVMPDGVIKDKIFFFHDEGSYNVNHHSQPSPIF